MPMISMPVIALLTLADGSTVDVAVRAGDEAKLLGPSSSDLARAREAQGRAEAGERDPSPDAAAPPAAAPA